MNKSIQAVQAVDPVLFEANRRSQMIEDHQRMLDTWHRETASRCLSSLICPLDHAENLQSKAKLAVAAATALLGAYGVKVQTPSPPST